MKLRNILLGLALSAFSATLYAGGAGGGWGDASGAMDARAAQPRIASSIEIPRAWISPTQPYVGQALSISAEVSGSNVSSVKVYYDLSPSGLLLLAELSDSDRDGVYTGQFVIPEIAAGTYSEFRIIATNSEGNQAFWPGVMVTKQVKDSVLSDFVASFNLTDPTRSYYSYHGDATLFADGNGKVREFIYDKPITPRYPETQDANGYLPVKWSYDKASQTFRFDWSLDGKLPGLGNFAGTIEGSTSAFTLSGHWSNGSAGQLTLTRTGIKVQ